MNLRNQTVLLLGATALFALAGCGSSNRESAIDQQTASFQASAGCISCHAGNKTSPVTGAQITDEWQKSAHNTKNGAACADCHTNSGHPNGGSIVKAVQDTQCATCHTTVKLGSPHFANYTTSLASQYVSQSDAAGVQCRQCHNPHDTTSLIQYNKDWADSGHGSTTYVPGNANASSVNSHYAWTTSSRDACSKCHTTTGYKNFTNGNAAPYMSNNKKNETIMCSACHQDYSWKRRNIGAQTLEYTYNAAPITLPDAKDSNLCLVCHSGRGNGQSARSSRFAGHHAPTGADLFAEYTHLGYEFAGLDYTKKSYFEHDTIGMTDGSGPCVSCHMKAANSHTFDVVTKDANGVITAIKSQAVCDSCHSGSYAMTAAKLEEESAGYQEAGTILKAYLANTIVNYKNAAIVYSSNPATMSDNEYGAYQNSLFPSEDPGGYAHNRYYVKRLIFDSIDFLDNSTFDGTITIDATTYPNAAAWFGAPAGTTGNYTATRP
ncbi:cytochrome c3 family protein [Geobacter sp.]|uniref:multiheme c-type cytochrome n=1 Tax=Geobacter sp. TaxID=46610 RepID=UPI002626524F|nr:cytochrome c3 family protein [Geobacter sp.]